jgi:hypothetical protein
MRNFGIVFLGMILLSGSRFALAQPATDSVLVAKSEALIEPIVRADQFSGTSDIQFKASKEIPPLPSSMTMRSGKFGSPGNSRTISCFWG